MANGAPRRRLTPETLNEIVDAMPEAEIIDGAGSTAAVDITAPNGRHATVVFEFGAPFESLGEGSDGTSVWRRVIDRTDTPEEE